MGNRRDAQSLRETMDAGVTLRKALRLLFVPWTDTEGTDQYDNVDIWKRAAAATEAGGVERYPKIFERVAYNGNPNPTLKTLRENDVMYVLGHCAPGSDKLWPYDDSADNDPNALSSAMVAERLIRTGLEKNWTGDLKLYACHSASPGAGSQSFLKAFGEHLGDYRCHIWGYKEGVASYPESQLAFDEGTGAMLGYTYIGNKMVSRSEARASTVREPLRRL